MDLFRHDWEHDDDILTSIVEAVEAVSGGDATDLDALYATVDPDALAGVLASFRRSGRPDGAVEFTFDRYRVAATAGGTIAVHRGTDRHDRVTTEADFRVAIGDVVRDAAASGVAVEGGWVVRSPAGGPGWSVEVSPGGPDDDRRRPSDGRDR